MHFPFFLFWAFDHINLVWYFLCEFCYSRVIYSREQRVEFRTDFSFHLNDDQGSKAWLVFTIWYILLISFLMKTGIYFERFIIITTSIHRDSLTSSWDSKNNNLWLEVLLIQIIQGVIISSLILLIIKVLKNKQLYTTQK